LKPRKTTTIEAWATFDIIRIPSKYIFTVFPAIRKERKRFANDFSKKIFYKINSHFLIPDPVGNNGVEQPRHQAAEDQVTC
jgi:hypothetical protein